MKQQKKPRNNKRKKIYVLIWLKISRKWTENTFCWTKNSVRWSHAHFHNPLNGWHENRVTAKRESFNWYFSGLAWFACWLIHNMFSIRNYFMWAGSPFRSIPHYDPLKCRLYFMKSVCHNSVVRSFLSIFLVLFSLNTWPFHSHILYAKNVLLSNHAQFLDRVLE